MGSLIEKVGPLYLRSDRYLTVNYYGQLLAIDIIMIGNKEDVWCWAGIVFTQTLLYNGNRKLERRGF